MKRKMNYKNLNWLWLSFIILIIDQFTKYLVSQNIPLDSSITIFPILDLVSAHNHGAAFSFLNDAGGWQQWLFGLLAIGVCIALVVWILKLPSSKKIIIFSASLVIAGALGNLIDRIYHGYVIDFIYFHVGQWYWPAFNIADSAIVVGAITLVLETLLRRSDND